MAFKHSPNTPLSQMIICMSLLLTKTKIVTLSKNHVNTEKTAVQELIPEPPFFQFWFPKEIHTGKFHHR